MLRPTLTALLAALCLALAPRPAAAAGGYLTLSAEDCTLLARHYTADDVTYRPGRDVRGKAVVPDDLDPGAGLILPDAVVIPLEIDLFARYGLPANSANSTEESGVGEECVSTCRSWWTPDHSKTQKKTKT